ncbi:hypothetical protein D9M72_172940 [compost metagenome]
MSDVKITLWPLENLIPYELNAKKHDAEQVAKIAESIKRYKWTQPIVVDKFGVIINGHGRRLAAMLLGPDSPTPGFAPVWQRSDLTPEQVRAARLADNRAAISDMDSEKLMLDMAGIDHELLTGIFDDKELNFLSVDHGEMNVGAFVSDMGAVVEGQKEDVARRMDNVKAQRIPLAKAFGFKDLSASDQIIVSNLMAKAEALTGLQGDAAFIKWADTQLQLSA